MKYQLLVIKDNAIIYNKFFEEKSRFIDNAIFFENEGFIKIEQYNNSGIYTNIYRK